jgi:hypothetical protein
MVLQMVIQLEGLDGPIRVPGERRDPVVESQGVATDLTRGCGAQNRLELAVGDHRVLRDVVGPELP